MICANDFSRATDSETLDLALQNLGPDGILVIPPRQSDIESDRTFWLLDRAILLPENTTVILQNCTIKLSDNCRDNFFRSENCGLGIADPKPVRNIHIRGEGLCTLIGADYPRSTGDAGKTLANPSPFTPEDLCAMAPWIPEERRSPEKLNFQDTHLHTYGTDAGKEGESQYGDWRNIGILLANVEHFSISGLRIVKAHAWAISMEACAYGRVEKIDFDACMSKEIDGMLQNIENQDGVNLRNGCHHIVISDITGQTGDDVIALTAAIRDDAAYVPGGSLRTTHVMHNDYARRDPDIHDVIIRNVIATTHLCRIIRLLPCNTRIWNVVIDGVIDGSPTGQLQSGTLLLGEYDTSYGTNRPGSLSGITVSNMVCHCGIPILVLGYLTDSAISNIVNTNSDVPVIQVNRRDGLKNVQIANITTGGKIVG